jgi:hypothetical protein
MTGALLDMAGTVKSHMQKMRWTDFGFNILKTSFLRSKTPA